MAPANKKRKLQSSTVDEITFDLDARQEYLTGFHKRKLQRAKLAQEAAEKKARAEKVEERRKLREERKAELQRHVEEVNALLRPAVETEDSENSVSGDSSATEWTGPDEPVPPVDHEAEYVDEEKYTTVTVEEIDVSRDGLHKTEGEHRGDVQQPIAESAEILAPKPKGRRGWTKEKPKDRAVKPKVKRKKFRYEGKAERKFMRMKEKSKNSKQAKARREG